MCDALRAAFPLGPSPTSLDQAKDVLRSQVAALETLDENAPTEIASDSHTLRVYFDDVESAVSRITTMDELVSAYIDAPVEIADASDRLKAYARSHCGLALPSP